MAVSARKTHRKASSTPRRKAHRASHSPATRSTRRSHAKPARRRSYSRRKKGFLAEMFTPASAMQAGTAMLMGGIGGIAAKKAVDDLFGTSIKKGGKVGILAGLSFFLAAVMKAPMAAAGVAAVAAIELATPSGVSEYNALAEKGYLQEQYLSQLPETLNEGYMNEGYMNEYNFENTDFTDFEEVM